MTFSNSINWLRRDGPRWENLGITYNAVSGLFSITQANGSALSQDNAGYVTIPSKPNPGQQMVYRITANQSFTDDNGLSTILGNLFGLTSSIAYAEDLPFYIYAVSNDSNNAVSFMISRIPSRSISPTSSFIGKMGSDVASTQGSFFALGNPTVTDYDQNPCVCIGAFRMQMNSSNDWTVQPLSNGTSSADVNFQADGIGCFHEGTKFLMDTGQFGAAAGSFFLNNGGTAPKWALQSQGFFITKSGLVRVEMSAATSTTGSGAVAATLALPFSSIDTGGCPGQFHYSSGLGVLVESGSTNLILSGISSAPAFISVTNATLAVSTYVHTYIISADTS